MYQDIGTLNWGKSYIAATASDMQDIAKPLQPLSLFHFSHISVYQDDSYSIFTTHPEFSELYVNRKFYRIALAGSYRDYQPGYFLTNSISDQTIFKALEENARLGNGFVIIRKNKQCCDFYHFYSRPGNCSINLFYLNHIDFFEQFVDDYCEKSKELIKLANDNRFIYPDTTMDITEFSFAQTTNVEKLLEEMFRKRKSHVVADSVILTNKERETLQFLVRGYSAKEVAKTLCRSPRTIEKHVAQLKNKFNVQSTLKLIAKVAKKRG